MQPVIESQRIQLKHHVFFKEIPDGTLFDAGRTSFVLRNKALYPVVARIIQLMDAGRAIGEIRAGLPSKLVDMFDGLIDTLHQHRMLRVMPGETASPFLIPNQARQFVRFLEDHHEQAESSSRFARWQQEQVLVAGGGYALKAVLNALVESDVGRIFISSNSNEADRLSRDEYASVLARHGRREGKHHEWREGIDGADWPVACRLVIYAADEVHLKHALACAEFAGANGVDCIVSGVHQGQGIVISAAAAEASKMASQLAAFSGAGKGNNAHSPASCALIGSVAAHNAIQLHFNIRRQYVVGHALSVSPWLEVTEHAIPAMQAERSDVARSNRIQLPNDRELSRYEKLRIAAAPWFDPLFGRFDIARTATLRQVPLFHDAISVRRYGHDEGVARLVAGWGTTPEEAGTRALAAALQASAELDFPGSPFVAAFDYQSWYDQALAGALVATPGFAQRCSVVAFDPSKLSSAKLQLLARLLRLYGSGPLQVRVYWVPGLPSYQVECCVGEMPVASAINVALLPAIEQAVGEACSRMQLQEHDDIYPPVQAFSRADAGWIENPVEWMSYRPPANPDLVAQMTLQTQFWQAGSLPMGTYCGRMTILEDVRDE